MKLNLKIRHLIPVAALLLAGCNNSPKIGLLPNADRNLRLTSTQFAADAAKRHPYKDQAPHGGTIAARANVDYGVNSIEIANLSDADWQNVEIWVNKNYVVFLPLMEPGNAKALPFGMLFDDSGNSFPTNNNKTKIASVELCKDGKFYDVTTQLAD